MGLAGEAGEEPGDLFLTHLSGVALVVVKDESLDPPNIGLFCFGAVA